MKGSKKIFLLFFLIHFSAFSQEKIASWSFGVNQGILKCQNNAMVLWNDLNLRNPSSGEIMNGSGYAVYQEYISRNITTLEVEKRFVQKKNTFTLGLNFSNLRASHAQVNDTEIFYENDLNNPLGNGRYELIKTYSFSRSAETKNFEGDKNLNSSLISLSLGYQRTFFWGLSTNIGASYVLNKKDVYPIHLGLTKAIKNKILVTAGYSNYSLFSGPTQIFGVNLDNLRSLNSNPIKYPRKVENLPATKELRESSNSHSVQIGIKYLIETTKKEKVKKEVKSTQF